MDFIAELSAPILLGLLHDSLLTLMGIGLTMTFSVTRMINFAHAELVTLGAYAVVVGVNVYGWGIGPALVASVLIGLVTAVLIDEAIYKPLTMRRAPDLYMMVAFHRRQHDRAAAPGNCISLPKTASASLRLYFPTEEHFAKRKSAI